MATPQALAGDRMRQAILAFQAAEEFFHRAHRRHAARPQAQVDAYWSGPGLQIEEDIRVACVEVVEAVETLAGLGMVVAASDRQTVLAARRHLAKGQAS